MNRRLRMWCAAALLALTAIAPPQPNNSGQNITVLLRLAGDDFTGTTLIPAIAKRFIQAKGGGSVTLVTPEAPWTQEVVGTQLDGTRIAVLIRASKSEDGFTFLQRNFADIAVSAIAIPPSAVSALRNIGDMGSSNATILLARAAFLPVVNTQNAISALTPQQLRDIYAGRITDWSQVGGAPGPIHAFARVKGAASRTEFDAMVMGSLPYGQSVNARVPTFGAMHANVANDPGAIGYLPYGQTEGLASKHLGPTKPLGLRIGGRILRADPFSIQTDDYPFSQTLRLYFSPNPSQNKGNVQAFLDEAQSAQTEIDLAFLDLFPITPQLLIGGTNNPVVNAVQQTLQESLQVAVPDNAFGSTALTDADIHLLKTLPGIARVSTTIHFRPGPTRNHEEIKALLDAADIERLDKLGKYLRFLRVAPERIRLVATSDYDVSRENSIAVSRALGDFIKQELYDRRVGIAMRDSLGNRITWNPVIALGATVPLTSDATAGGRWLNRRVETWILP